MLAQQPTELDILDSEETQESNQETARYLAYIEQKLYQDIQTRKRIDSGLLFIACQFSSCSLSWLLFQLQVTLLIIQVSSACLAMLPGLIDMGDSFNFSISSESWEFTLGQKPLIGIIKLAIGCAVSFSGTSKITSEIVQTQNAIAQTYHEIRSSEGLSFQLPNMGMSLLLALAGIVLIGIIKKIGVSSNENQG